MEESLFWAVYAIGPLITFGDPSERAPKLGAYRSYSDSSRWRDEFRELAQAATLIVINHGVTPGVRWEIDHVLRTTPLDKIVFFVAPGPDTLRQRKYDAICGLLAKHGVGTLSPYVDDTIFCWPRGSCLSALTPAQGMRKRMTWTRKMMMHAYHDPGGGFAAEFTYALRPVLEYHGATVPDQLEPPFREHVKGQVRFYGSFLLVLLLLASLMALFFFLAQ